jgi:hypothetical protein
MGSIFKRLDPNAPYRRGAAVTPNDGTAIEETHALSVSVAGNVNVQFPNGSTAILPLPAGTTKLAVTKVLSTSTTATGIAALYITD